MERDDAHLEALTAGGRRGPATSRCTSSGRISRSLMKDQRCRRAWPSALSASRAAFKPFERSRVPARKRSHGFGRKKPGRQTSGRSEAAAETRVRTSPAGGARRPYPRTPRGPARSSVRTSLRTVASKPPSNTLAERSRTMTPLEPGRDERRMADVVLTSTTRHGRPEEPDERRCERRLARSTSGVRKPLAACSGSLAGICASAIRSQAHGPPLHGGDELRHLLRSPGVGGDHP